MKKGLIRIIYSTRLILFKFEVSIFVSILAKHNFNICFQIFTSLKIFKNFHITVRLLKELCNSSGTYTGCPHLSYH